MVEGLAVFALKKRTGIRRQIERRSFRPYIPIHDGCFNEEREARKEKVGITTACSHRREEWTVAIAIFYPPPTSAVTRIMTLQLGVRRI